MTSSAQPVRFTGTVRRFTPGASSGLAVVDVPDELVDALGGRRQMSVSGTVGGVPHTGSSMLVAGGGLCVSVRAAVLKAAGVAVGDDVELEIAAVPKG
jgi:hypothetical protein